MEIETQDCPRTNQIRNNAECIACELSNVNHNGLSFSIDNSRVSFAEREDNKLHIYEIINNIIQPKKEESLPNGSDSDKDALPGQNEYPLQSEYQKITAKIDQKVFALSLGSAGENSVGILYFYNWDVTSNSWAMDASSIQEGKVSLQRLGQYELKFMNENMTPALTLICQNNCPIHSNRNVQTEPCVCIQGFLASKTNNFLSKTVTSDDTCVLAIHSPLVNTVLEIGRYALSIDLYNAGPNFGVDEIALSIAGTGIGEEQLIPLTLNDNVFMEGLVPIISTAHNAGKLYGPLELCAGSCRDDDDCIGDLTCHIYIEDSPQPPQGCKTPPSWSKYNYCIDGSNAKEISLIRLKEGVQYSVNITTNEATVSFPIVPSCSCDPSTNPDQTGRPKGLLIQQDQGHIMFEFTDNSRCETSFSFTRFTGHAEFRDVNKLSESFTSDFLFLSSKECGGVVTPLLAAHDDLQISKLYVGRPYSYCVRAVRDGHYMERAIDDSKISFSGSVSSSHAICRDYTITWEASIDGLITTEPNAGSLPIKTVTVTWDLLSADGNQVLDCNGCSGTTTTDDGGAFNINFNVHHTALKDKNLADIPVQIKFNKITSSRNGDIQHIFLCNGGQDVCKEDGDMVYLKHLHFDTPLHIYDDTSLPFTGYLTVYNTQYTGSDGCAIADAQICLQHYTVGGNLENLVCVESQYDGLFEAPVVIGSVVNNVKITYSSHDFEKTLKNNWDYSAGVVISDAGFYSGNDFMDVTRAKMNVEGEFTIRL